MLRPHTRETGHALSRNCEVSTTADQDFLQPADEFDRAERLALAVGSRKSAQIEDRIADDLPGPVKCNVTTAIALEDFDAALGKEFRGSDHVCGFGVAAQRDHGRVFEQEEYVANLFFLAQSDELLLQAEPCGVVNAAELDDGDQIRFARAHTEINQNNFTIETRSRREPISLDSSVSL